MLTAVLDSQPAPPPWVAWAALGAALVAVLSRSAWPLTRSVITIAHEGGHAAVALAGGRRLAGIRVHADTSGVSVSVGRRTGLGMVLTLLAGYLMPAGLGLAAAAALAAGRVGATLVGALVLLALILLQIRNLYGLMAPLLAAGAVVAVLRWAGPAAQSGFGYLLAWFLLVGGLRAVWELAAAPRRRGSDADQLARLTGVPALVWIVVFGIGTLACVAFGGLLLLP